MPPSKSLFSSSLFPPAPFFATRTTAHTPFFIFLPPFRFVKADDVSARSRSRASKKRGWARERSASSSRFFFRRKHRCFLFWNSNACCAPPLRTLFRSLSARPLSVNAFRDASRGRLRWLLGRLRTVRGRWRGRGKAFFNASLSIQRNAWKRKRGAPFPSFRASRPSPSPLVLARDPSRDAHGRLPKPTRERFRRQRQDKAFWGGAALFCPLAFFFSRWARRRRRCAPLPSSSLTFSLALFSLSPFSRLCFFLALSSCLARWGRTCASIGVRFKGRKEADARERGKEGALERERKQRH